MSFQVSDRSGSLVNTPLWDPGYRFASASLAPGAAPTTIVQLTGAASTKVRVKNVRLMLSGAISTNPKAVTLTLRSTTASTAGNARTPGKVDSSQTAAAAVLADFTTAPVAGTSTAVIGSGYLGLQTAQGVSVLEWVFSNKDRKSTRLNSSHT